MPEPLRYQNPELQDMLASNYVLGTLRGPARKRFERLMLTNSELSRRVHQWEAKMQPIHQTTPSIKPYKTTWKKILNSINPGTNNALIEALQKQLRLYKSFTALAFTCALVVGIVAWSPWLAQPTGGSINYVAVLKDNQQTPTMVVTLNKTGRLLTLDMLEKPQIKDGKNLQLWAISHKSGETKSLGAIKLEKHVEKSLSKPQWGLIKNAEYLIVSVEDPNLISPIPTGRIISKGLCVKVEGWKSKTS